MTTERQPNTDQLIARATELRVGLQSKVDELLWFVDQLRRHLDDDAEGEADDARHA